MGDPGSVTPRQSRQTGLAPLAVGILLLLAGDPARAALPSRAGMQPASLPTAGDMTATAAAHGFKQGLHLLRLGYCPVRDLLDWSDPPMDSSADWLSVDGVQFGAGRGQVNLEDLFKAVPVPPRLGLGWEHLAWRADGWLWVERPGEYAFRIAAADDAGRLSIGGRQLVHRSRHKASESLSVKLARGFHRMRLDGFNGPWSLSLLTEWKPPDAEQFAAIPAVQVFRGHALQEGPRLFQAAVAEMEYDYSLRVAGGRAPYEFALVGGKLPEGLSLSPEGRLSGRPARPGFFRFTVAVRDARGIVVAEPLGLRVLPAQTHRDRNDAEVFQLSFDETDPETLRGGLIAGRGTYEGLKTAGDYALYPWHSPAEGKTRSIAVADGLGAFGSRRCAVIEGARDYGFYLCGQQGQVMSDHMPAFRRGNRFSVTFRIPTPVRMTQEQGTTVCDWRTDPRAFGAKVLYVVHMAGHNVTRFAGHEKEQWNWHFYHPRSHYWGDHWQAANLDYLGDGWWYYETSNQPTSQRQGTVEELAGAYEPMQDTDAVYFETLNRFYHVIDLGWGRTDSSYATHRFYIDQLRIWRQEPAVEMRHTEKEKVARVAIPTSRKQVDVPFLVRHSGPRPVRYWIAKFGVRIPTWDGKGIFVDRNANGTVDPDEPELEGMETPSFQPGQTRHFVYRVSADRLAAGRTGIAGVSLRVHDREDPLSLCGDSMMILIHKSDRPGQVSRGSLTSLSRAPVPENLPPTARIDGPRSLRVRVQQPVRLSGSVSDPDGPRKPQAVWDFGDDTQYEYGTAVEHRYAQPGTYTVRLRACDSILDRADSITVDVLGD